MNQRENALHKERRPSPRNAKETRTFARVYRQIPLPRGYTKSRCKQVSRLGFILLAHLPAFAVVSCGLAATRFRRLHGYWDSPELSSDSFGAFRCQKSVAHRCAVTPAIHLSYMIISVSLCGVNPFLKLLDCFWHRLSIQ